MWFGKYLVECGDVSKDQLIDAISTYCEGRLSIGAIAISCKLLSVKQVFAILEKQSEIDKPFGEVAMELGFLSLTDLHYLLGRQRFESNDWQKALLEQEAISEDDLTKRRREWYRMCQKPIASESHLLGP